MILWCLWCSIVTYDIQCKREGFLQRIKDEEGEGCNIYGFIEVNKVAGNFHFAPGKSFHQSGVHVHDLLAFQKDSFNVSYDQDDSGCFIINNTQCILWKWNLWLSCFSYFLLLTLHHGFWWMTCKYISVIQVSHKITRLSFGDYFPGVVNPLDK